MKKTLFTTILLLFALFQGFSQDYATLAKKAYKVYEDKEYAKSVEIFEQAFKLDKPKSSDLYNAACSASLATQTDKAFDFLGQAIDAGYSNLGHLKSDTDLGSLYKDNRWRDIIAKIEKKQAEAFAKLKYPEISIIVDSMVVNDQRLRSKKSDLVRRGFNQDSQERQNLLIERGIVDSLNMIELKRIFKNYGFMGFNEVGIQSSQYFWFLIQLCDKDPNFQAEVLSEMKRQVDTKNANASDYAYLVDRVRINTGMPQIYGTQTTYNEEKGTNEPKSLLDPENVNKRRAELGIITLEEHIQIENNRVLGIRNRK
jgi:hypothetical protein